MKKKNFLIYGLCTVGICSLFSSRVAIPQRSVASSGDATDVISIMQLALVPLNTVNLIEEKLSQPRPGASHGLAYQTYKIPLGQNGERNPLGSSKLDFNTGIHLMMPGDHSGPPPEIPEKDLSWFDDVVAAKKLPDVVIIGGHNVIPEGWHSNDLSKNIYLPSILQALKTHPNMKKVFDQAKFVVLGGCNTLSDLEPHGPHGEYLDQTEIEKIYKESPAGRTEMVGTSSDTNTLEMYKGRLLREYGPGTAEYGYTRTASEEHCLGPNYHECIVDNLERVMPESGLFDGSHRYNRTEISKEMFPNAYLILGMNSAAPNEDVRSAILKRTLRASELELAKRGFNVGNTVQAIVSQNTPDDARKQIIEVVRKYWTRETYKFNRGRPSGSITPAYPDLDQGTAFNEHPRIDNANQIYGEYEPRPDR